MNERATAFPVKQYTGEDDASMDYETYIADKEAFNITKGLEYFFAQTDPSTIPRVTTPYTVPLDDSDDPNGDPGENVRVETETHYNNRLRTDATTDKTTWALYLPGWGKKAREAALRAPIKYSARSAVRQVDQECGTKTEKQVTKLVKEFTGREKSVKQSIEDFNKEWVAGVRTMNRNGMTLPDKFIISLYLNSLGLRYRTLDAVAGVLPESERTLDKIMQMAVDHTAEESDEADHHNIALAASNRTKKRKHNGTALAATGDGCAICGNFFHAKEECFREGGGLSHLSRQEQRTHLLERRLQKSRDHQNRSWVRPQQQPPAPTAVTDGKALAAMQQQLSDMQQRMTINSAANASGAQATRELEMLKQQVWQAGVDVSHAPIDYDKLSDTLGYRCHE